jgi:hypothetical protein
MEGLACGVFAVFKSSFGLGLFAHQRRVRIEVAGEYQTEGRSFPNTSAQKTA